MVGRVSPRRRTEIIDALRRGTVPSHGLDLLAVGIDRFDAAVDTEIETVAGGGSVFKAVRGEYGTGKTFFTRHLAERALKRGLAAAQVQISETETPLHRLETVYRRVTESLRTASTPPSAFYSVLDSWLFTLESDVLDADYRLADASSERLAEAVQDVLDRRLADVTTRTPTFALALRAYHRAVSEQDTFTSNALAAWIGGQPHIAAAAKRKAGVRGDLDQLSPA